MKGKTEIAGESWLTVGIVEIGGGEVNNDEETGLLRSTAETGKKREMSLPPLTLLMPWARCLRSTGKNGQKQNVSGLFCFADTMSGSSVLTLAQLVGQAESEGAKPYISTCYGRPSKKAKNQGCLRHYGELKNLPIDCLKTICFGWSQHDRTSIRYYRAGGYEAISASAGGVADFWILRRTEMKKTIEQKREMSLPTLARESELLRSTGKNGQKRNATSFLDDLMKQSANNTLWAIAA